MFRKEELSTYSRSKEAGFEAFPAGQSLEPSGNPVGTQQMLAASRKVSSLMEDTRQGRTHSSGVRAGKDTGGHVVVPILQVSD